MKLRRVVISGFKTFARRSEILIEPGITAIVGPNGSGKSNFVDAVRWALGETNARELRGARMDEVIYSGGGARGRMGVAEVELVLDNDDSALAVPDPEISVSRRVTRGAESEYRLNGERARLRDLERLLGTTGLTQSGYSVVAQNDIDGIIEATPVQRRALVEQAAGVRSLRAASEDALSRVRQAEITLHRFQDLLADAEPRLADLAAQAALALEQRELTERLVQLRGNLAREEWRAARAQLKQARRRADAAQARLQTAAEADAGLRQRVGAQREKLEAARQENNRLLALLEAARLAAERAEGESRRYADRRRSGALQRTAAAAEIELLLADLGAAQRMEAEFSRSAEETEAAMGAAKDAATAADLAYEREHAAWQDAEARRAQAQSRLATAEAAVAKARAASVARQAQLQLFGDSSEMAEQEATEVEARLELLATEVAQADASENEAETRLHELQLRLGEARQISARAEEAMRLAEERLAALTGASREALLLQAALRGQVEGALGGSDGLEAAVERGDLAAQRLLDLIRVRDPQDGAAVEAALEPYLGAWVVDDPAGAAVHVELQGRRTVLLNRQADAGPAPADIPGARRLIDAVEVLQPGARTVVAALFAACWIVPDAATADLVLAAGGRAVFADGRLCAGAELRIGGGAGSTLEGAVAESDAAAAVRRAEAAEETGRVAVETARAELNAASQREREIAAAISSAQAALAAAVAHRAARAGAQAAEQRQLEVLRRGLAKREQENAQLRGQGESIASLIAAAEEEMERARGELTEIRATIEELEPRLRAAEEAVRKADTELTRHRLGAEDLEQRRRLATDTTELVQSRLGAAQMRLLGAEAETVVAIVRGGLAQAQSATRRAEVERWEAEVNEGRPLIAEMEGRIALLESERSEGAIALARAEDESAAAAAEVDACAARVAELAEAVRDDMEDEGPEPDAGDAERAEREILRLERRISALGPVNALAPEQHAALDAQVTTLRDNSGDLSRACADIRAMAVALTAEIDNRFSAVFGAVGVHFQELFNELFPGGKATLRLQETDAGAESPDGEVEKRLPGVEILAQPPGKRLQPLSLLSGGERALTALAMILALQQVNPSPFYIFDEVDAPLDDTNVLRFTKLMKRLANRQQFIVVTHNHVTMAAADALYGISIDGDGISNVLSVRFEEAHDESEIMGLRRPLRAAAS